MRVIFLDIDGVLNCRSTEARCGGLIGVDDKKVKLLANIVEKTNAKIVLVSSWKTGWSSDFDDCSKSAQYLVKKLNCAGLHIFAATKDASFNRGEGIQNYLAQFQAESWIVLDDEIFDDYEQCDILSHLVKTSFYGDGLTEELAEKAINLLLDQ